MKSLGQRIIFTEKNSDWSSESKKEKELFWERSNRSFNSFQYQQECSDCKKSIIVETQKDDDPEYYAYVYVKCDCGGFVKFELPVN